MNERESRWMNAKEAALYVGRSAKNAYRTMLRLARNGKIKAGYEGKAYRFRKEDLDRWLYRNGKRGSKQKEATIQ